MNVENIVQETANLLEACVHNGVQFIVKASFIGAEKWHRYTGIFPAKNIFDEISCWKQ